MSVSTDSIQTLLKQRRELRGYLKELRDEISALNKRADKITAQDEGEAINEQHVIAVAGEGQGTLETVSPGSEGSVTKDAETAKPADQAGSEIKTVPYKINPEDPPIPSAPPLEEVTATVSEKTGRSEGEPHSENPTTPKLVAEPEMARIQSEEEGVDGENLLYQAKLLSEYFLNHPAPVNSDLLTRLDKNIKQCENAKTADALEQHLPDLREAYRIVAAKSYTENGINGETLVDSGSSITLLWVVPLYIATLTLVLFPLLLLSRSIANQMFVADFSGELGFVMTCITAFLWGAVGTLSYITWGIANNAKNKLYRIGSVRDVGLQATLGGVLGIVVFLCLVGWITLDSIIPDMVIGIMAFFAGLVSSIVFAFLHRMIRKLTRKAETKTAP